MGHSRRGAVDPGNRGRVDGSGWAHSMSYNRHAKSCDANELGIVKALEAAGALVYRIGRPVDLLVGYDRTWYAMEVKQPKGRLTESQEDFMEATADRGLLAGVVRNATEALALIGCETRGVEIGHRVPVTSPWLDGTSTGGSSNEAG